MTRLASGEGRTVFLAFLLSTTVAFCTSAASAQDNYPAQPGKDWPIYGGSYNNRYLNDKCIECKWQPYCYVSETSLGR